MSGKILFQRGSSLTIAGEWLSGDPLTPNTILTAVVTLPVASARMSEHANFPCQVKIVTDRDFEIYAAEQDTALWPTGSGALTVTRREVNYYPNGDDLVDVRKPVPIEVY